MSKTAFIFPGQGAQYIGMAMDFIEQNPEFKTIIENFDKKNGTNLFQIMKEGPEELLKETKFTQPAILFHSIVAMKTLLNEIDIKPDFVAGHSLGEFSALVANEVLDFEDALYLVHRRGEFMIKANEGKPFAMAAIIGPDSAKVKEFCESASSEGIVIAANYNTPVQTVISGSKAGVDKACELASAAGAKRVVPLVVGAPFHSPLIEKAGNWLAEEMDKINFKTTEIPVISNVDAKPVSDPEQIKKNLAEQVTSSVLWVDSINNLIKDGVEIFIEFGPKKVLAGMIKKIDRSVKVMSIDKLEDVEKVKVELV
ncbi:MAG TPA: [acyl-carrier-protein] S-malonyltransferase [Candidatus Cloacimonetes bacterium]|nr:[acyl-carrier-protein] S-malonyltransferase [Candidatus Cloacimonadota bacterium]